MERGRQIGRWTALVTQHRGLLEGIVSSTVPDLTAGSDLGWEDIGEHELKGIPNRWRLCRVAE